MHYTVNNIRLHYEPNGERRVGDDIVMLDQDIDLTAKTKWAESGYTIQELFDETLFEQFKINSLSLLVDLWRKAELAIPFNFKLNQYHTLANTSTRHLAAVEMTKLIDVQQFPIPIKHLEDRISAICHEQLIVKNPFDGQSVFHFRVIRPLQEDNNPLHRDVWLDDYKDCINLYIPITGSNDNSSLIIVPGSHRWQESKVERTVLGADLNGVKFNVPAVTEIKSEATYLRPDPKENEVLVFSPYLIHGGSSNLNGDATRISIEVRLWKK